MHLGNFLIGQLRSWTMRKLTILCISGALALAALLTGTLAVARPSSPNGQIAFARFEAALGDSVFYTVNPDGSHERQVLPFALECPHWSPDGRLIASCGTPSGDATLLVNPDSGTYRSLPQPDPSLVTACFVWSPDAQRLACELADPPADPGRNGIYTIRSSDGGGLTRMTTNRAATTTQATTRPTVTASSSRGLTRMATRSVCSSSMSTAPA
jgi:hypothetical protein